MSDFDDSEIAFSLLPDNASYSVGDDSSSQPKKKRNNSQGYKQDMTNFDYLESELSKLPEELLEITSSSKENLHQSGQTQAL